MKRPIGKCHICGKECELTYEHIPPAGAYNDMPAKVITGKEYFKNLNRLPWDTKGLHYENMQNGVGIFSLCEKCNNDTGSWYANEYILFSNFAYNELAKDRENVEKSNCVTFHVYKMHPLRFFKQVISMFLSTIHEEYIVAHPELKEYLLDKNSKAFPYSKIRVGMYVQKNPVTSWTGINGIISTDGTKVVASLDVAPFGFVMFFNQEGDLPNIYADITELGYKYGYDDIAEYDFVLSLFERNIALPMDFRTKEEIIHTYEKNKEK